MLSGLSSQILDIYWIFSLPQLSVWWESTNTPPSGIRRKDTSSEELQHCDITKQRIVWTWTCHLPRPTRQPGPPMDDYHKSRRRHVMEIEAWQQHGHLPISQLQQEDIRRQPLFSDLGNFSNLLLRLLQPVQVCVLQDCRHLIWLWCSSKN